MDQKKLQVRLGIYFGVVNLVALVLTAVTTVTFDIKIGLMVFVLTVVVFIFAVQRSMYKIVSEEGNEKSED